MDGVADWYGDHNDMAHTLFLFETSPILFGTSNGVLIYEDGLKVLTWPQAMERIAPQVEEAKQSASLSDASRQIQQDHGARSSRRSASSRR